MKNALIALILLLVLAGCQHSESEAGASSPAGVTMSRGAPNSGWEAPKTPTEKEAWRLFFEARDLWSVNNPEAIVIGRKAVQTLQPGDSNLAHGSLMNNVAMIMNMRDTTLDESLALSRQALKYNEKGSDHVGIFSTYRNMGDAYEWKNDLPNRNKYWRMAKQIAVVHNLTENMHQIDNRLARIESGVTPKRRPQT